MKIPSRTWEQVAQEYSVKNPDDPISAKQAASIGKSAIARLEEFLEEEPDIKDDLVSLLKKTKGGL